MLYRGSRSVLTTCFPPGRNPYCRQSLPSLPREDRGRVWGAPALGKTTLGAGHRELTLESWEAASLLSGFYNGGSCHAGRWGRKVISGLTHMHILCVTMPTCQARSQWCNDILTAFWLDLGPTSQEADHALYCRLGQRPTTGEVIVSSAKPKLLLFC